MRTLHTGPSTRYAPCRPFSRIVTDEMSAFIGTPSLAEVVQTAAKGRVPIFAAQYKTATLKLIEFSESGFTNSTDKCQAR